MVGFNAGGNVTRDERIQQMSEKVIEALEPIAIEFADLTEYSLTATATFCVACALEHDANVADRLGGASDAFKIVLAAAGPLMNLSECAGAMASLRAKLTQRKEDRDRAGQN